MIENIFILIVSKLRVLMLTLLLLFLAWSSLIVRRVSVVEGKRATIFVIGLLIILYLFEIFIGFWFENYTFVNYTILDFFVFGLVLFAYRSNRVWLIIYNVTEDFVYDTLLTFLRNKKIDFIETRGRINISKYNVELEVQYNDVLQIAVLSVQNKDSLSKLNMLTSDLLLTLKGKKLNIFPRLGIICLIIAVLFIVINTIGFLI